MNPHHRFGIVPCLIAMAGLAILSRESLAVERSLYVSPTGNDRAAGTQQAPFQTVHRAQEAARTLSHDMQGDVVVHLAPGDYRLDRPLEFTEADSGRNGFRVVYRSDAGPGQARLLGSIPLKGWQADRDGIWKIALPPKTMFHTLYEQGRRLHKARFPNYEHHPDMPTALGRYAVSVNGTPKGTDRNHGNTRGPAWLEYRPEDAPPVTAPGKMQIEIFTGGKWDWMRDIYRVTAIDPQTRRLTFFAESLPFGVGTGARYFLEDDLGLLDTAGEFFVDDKAHVLYCIPWGKGHPDQLGLCAPVVSRLIQIQGKSSGECVERLCLDGLALEETDDSPPTGWWNTGYGRNDGALVWMSNTSHAEIRNCHLKNSGRSGIMMIGHNTENLVTGCWIEHTGTNGVTLCNRFLAADGKSPTTDRCEHNRVHNCRINNIGELHTYAECITVFNASDNEVDHCELRDCVRYAVTIRGNTGEQYGPPVSTNLPPAKGNHFHHLRVARCGQDGGDMGALHAANLNNPGGGCVNTFEQITVADTRAVDSMKDIPPDGIFLDWPKMAMDQIFRNVQIIRPQGTQLRSHKPENGASAQTENVSWKPGFREDQIDAASIGLTAEFPAQYGSRPSVVSWPAPTGEALSEDYQLKVSGQPVPVHACRVSAMPFNQVWPGYQRPLDQTELAGFACWDMAGSVQIEIQSRLAVQSAVVRPTSLGIRPVVKGNCISFSLNRPGPVVVEVNGTHHALHLFASPPETNAPTPTTPGVRFFGPGVHRPGKIELKNDETVYLAGGAVVYGSIQATGVKNIRVVGRGILDVGPFERGKGGGAVRLSDCSNVTIEGIVMRDPDVWCCSLFGCSQVTISNVKLVGLWRYNADGIDVCNSQDVVVSDSFVRAFDDALVLKGLKFGQKSFDDRPVRNVQFRRCVLWCDWGRAMEIGAETCAPEIADITFEDCDIVRTTHIAMDIQHGDRAAIRNIRFHRIRVEIDAQNPRPRMQKNREEKYQASDQGGYCPTLMEIVIRKNFYSKDSDRGTVRDVVFKDITVYSPLEPPSSFRGLDADHTVEGVTIENLRFNDRPIRSATECRLSIGPHVKDVRVVETAVNAK
jgi:hypothetical protein